MTPSSVRSGLSQDPPLTNLLLSSQSDAARPAVIHTSLDVFLQDDIILERLVVTASVEARRVVRSVVHPRAVVKPLCGRHYAGADTPTRPAMTLDNL